MWCGISARPSSTGAPDTAPPPQRFAAWAGLALAIALVGLAVAAAYPSRSGRATPCTHGMATPPDELLVALGLQRPPQGAVVPRFVLRTLEGQPVSTERLRGKVVLLSFFTTWCPSCRAEIPALQHLAARFRGTDFVLLLVNYGEALETVRPFAGDLGFAHAVLLDPETRVGDTFGVKFLPTHFLIGRRSELLATGMGPKAWDGPEAIRLIGSLL